MTNRVKASLTLLFFFIVSSVQSAWAREWEAQDAQFITTFEVNCDHALEVNTGTSGQFLLLNGKSLDMQEIGDRKRLKVCAREDAFQENLWGWMEVTHNIPRDALKLGDNTVTMNFRVHHMFPKPAGTDVLCLGSSSGYAGFEVALRTARGWRATGLAKDYLGCVPEQDVFKKNVFFSLADLSPGLAESVASLRNSVADSSENTRTRNAQTDRDNETFEQTERALEEILQKDLLDLTDDDIARLDDALVSETIGDLKRSIQDLKKESEGLLQQIGGELSELEDRVAARKLDRNLPDVADAVTFPPLPPVDRSDEASPTLDLNNNPYRTLAEYTLNELQARLDALDQAGFLAVASAWAAENDRLRKKLEQQEIQLIGEVQEFRKQTARVQDFINRFLNDGDFFARFVLSQDVRRAVTDDLAPYAPENARALTMALGTWSRDLTPQQRRLAHAIVVLGQFATESAQAGVENIDAFRRSVGSAVNTAYQLAVEAGKCAAILSTSGTLGDLYEIFVGRDLCSGAELSTGDRTFTAVATIVTLGSGRYVSKVMRSVEKGIEKLGTGATSAAEATEKLLLAAERYGIKEQGLATYARIHGALEKLPARLSIERIRQGNDPTKIAIIGRSMGNAEQNLVGVRDAAKVLEGEGVKVTIFEPSEAAGENFASVLREYRRQVGDQGAFLPDDIVKTTLTFKENQEWADRLKAEGFTVLDIGNPNNLELLSVFYEMEKSILF